MVQMDDFADVGRICEQSILIRNLAGIENII